MHRLFQGTGSAIHLNIVHNRQIASHCLLRALLPLRVPPEKTVTRAASAFEAWAVEAWLLWQLSIEMATTVSDIASPERTPLLSDPELEFGPRSKPTSRIGSIIPRARPAAVVVLVVAAAALVAAVCYNATIGAPASVVSRRPFEGEGTCGVGTCLDYDEHVGGKEVVLSLSSHRFLVENLRFGLAAQQRFKHADVK